MTTTENRKHQRQKIDFLASIRTQNCEHEILVKDISMGGMKVQSRQSANGLSLGEETEITVHIPFIADVKATLCWNYANTHGLCFKDCPAVLRQFMESILPVGDHISQQLST